jgi:hypothetical protein
MMFFVVIIVIAIAVIATLVFLHGVGARQVTVHTTKPLGAARATVEKAFANPAWAQVNGPGNLNYRARGRQNGPTLSASFEEAEDGHSTRVTLWPSSYNKLWGIAMQHATLCWRKNSAVARRLTQ